MAHKDHARMMSLKNGYGFEGGARIGVGPLPKSSQMNPMEMGNAKVVSDSDPVRGK
jgi:hypothetical protein